MIETTTPPAIEKSNTAPVAGVGHRVLQAVLALALLLVLGHFHAMVGRTVALLRYGSKLSVVPGQGMAPKGPPDRPMGTPPQGNGEPTPPPNEHPPPSGIATLPLGEIMAGVQQLARLPKGDPATIRAAQATKLVKIIQSQEKLVARADGVLKSGMAKVFVTLTDEQKRYIEGHPPIAQHGLGDPNAGPTGDPLGSHLIGLLETRAGVKAAALEAPPPFGPVAMNSANPQIYREGLITLEDAPGLKLTREQALAILPYVRDEVRVNTRQIQVARRLVGALSAGQCDKIMELHGSGSSLNAAPHAVVADLRALVR